MNGIGSQVATRAESIPVATVLSSDVDTLQLYVQALAHRYQPDVVVLHVVDLGSTPSGSDASLPVRIYRASEEKWHHDLTSDREGIHAATKLLETGPEPSLIVIGTRGGPGDLSRMVLGSTAREYLHQGHTPVLTIGPGVPVPEKPVHFRNIVYATDYSPEAAKACVSAFSFPQDFGAQVYVCHVLPDPEGGCGFTEEDLNDRFIDALETLVPEVSPEWIDPDCVLDYKFAAAGILLIAQRVKANLIVLGTRRARRRLNESSTGLAFQVISGSSCPVLSVQT
jgi:nucleotide-binding universal stress UspA family protein